MRQSLPTPMWLNQVPHRTCWVVDTDNGCPLTMLDQVSRQKLLLDLAMCFLSKAGHQGCLVPGTLGVQCGTWAPGLLVLQGMSSM